MTRPHRVATFHLAIEPVARSPTMNSVRLLVLTAVCAVLATPIASVAAPTEAAAGDRGGKHSADGGQDQQAK